MNPASASSDAGRDVEIDVAEVLPAAARTTDTERRLHDIWSELLGRERIGRTESFFDAGGHSMMLIDLHVCISTEFGPGVELLDLFRNPTIAAQVELVESGEPAPHPEPEAASRTHRSSALADMRRRRHGNG